MSSINIKNLTVHYGQFKALSDINLEIENSEIVGIVGPNGAGKTTLYNAIFNMIKPTTGNIEINDKMINTMTIHKIIQLGLKRTFQENRVIGALTVEENLILALQSNEDEKLWTSIIKTKYYQDRFNKIKTKASQIIEEYNIDVIRNNLASQISYGQQKLLSILCAIGNGAEFLFLDEPLAGISPHQKKEILILLKSLNDNGVGIIIIEHDISLLKEICDRIIFISSGNIVFDGKVSEMNDNSEILNAYIR